MSTDVCLDDAVIARVLRSPTGMVARDLTRRALLVDGRAKDLCPVDTGRLRASIRWLVAVDGLGLYALVGTNVAYARLVHDGTRPHVIEPRNRQVLRFNVGERVVFARRVFHPGTQGRPFLTLALVAAA